MDHDKTIEDESNDFFSNHDNRGDPKNLDWDNLSGLLAVRNEITAKLIDSYERSVVGCAKTRELVLVSGPPGVGKTSLALSLKSHVEADNGCLVSVKFDALEANFHGTPTKTYSALTDAFNEYIKHVAEAGEEKNRTLKQALEANMDVTKLQVLEELFPDLSSVLECKKHRMDERPLILKGADAEIRFIHIFNRFLRAICLQGSRIVLLLDDLQWANQGVLNLLKSLLLVPEEDCKTLMVMGTCRSNEISADHPFSIMLRDIEFQRILVTWIPVSNMLKSDVNIAISSMFQVAGTDSKPLADIVFEQTQGNLLFLVQLLKALRDGGVIFYEINRWAWDMTRVTVAANVGSISRLIRQKVKCLDESAQEMLRIASCLGNTFPAVVLGFACEVDADDVNDAIQAFV